MPCVLQTLLSDTPPRRGALSSGARPRSPRCSLEARGGAPAGDEFLAAQADEALAQGGQLRFALWDRQWSPASAVTPVIADLYRLPFAPGGGHLKG